MSGGKARMARRRRKRSIGAGNDWTPDSKEKAAHPNSRFATPMRNNPVLDPEVEKGEGVPISAIIFGGRRSDTMPLVFRRSIGITAFMSARRWVPKQPRPRPAPSARCAAIRWRCCRSAATTWANISSIGSTSASVCTNPPLIFHVNWFRKGANGKFLWPGFGDNMRVLKWIIDRCEGHGGRSKRRSAASRVRRISISTSSTSITQTMAELLGIDPEEWKKELEAHKSFSSRSAATCRGSCREARESRHAFATDSSWSDRARLWGAMRLAIRGVQTRGTVVTPFAEHKFACEDLRTARLASDNLRWVRRTPTEQCVTAPSVKRLHRDSWRASEQSQRDRSRSSARAIDRHHRPERKRQIESGLRDDLR